jgi:hypothetical protein
MIQDICAANHKGDSCSVAANPSRSAKDAVCEALYQEAVRRGPKGAIAESLYFALDLPHHTGSARCSDLKADGRLIRTTRRGQTVSGCSATVLIADIYAGHSHSMNRTAA